MTVKKHDMDAVTRLVEGINDDGDRQQVSGVEGVQRTQHGVEVTLSVRMPTRSKGLQDDEDGEHDQWTELRDGGDGQ